MTSKNPIVLPLIKVVLSSKITVVGISLGLSLLGLVAGFLWHRKRKYTGNLSSPENEPTPSKDKVEIIFLRIANLLITICPSAVRVYFDKQIPPNELKTFLGLENNNKILVSLLKRCIITQVQWQLLFPSGKNKKSFQLQSSPVWNGSRTKAPYKPNPRPK